MAENKPYAGKISNAGAQVVKAPYTTQAKKKTGKKTGTDLRSGK